jgi:dephospho-CoA kinase
VILGVSGLNGAGKGEVVGILASEGFHAVSLSDVIRDQLGEQGLEPTRERMIETGNAIRAAEGQAGLATRLAAKFERGRDYVVDSIRHPAEAETLRALADDFRLIWVAAAETVRFERMRQRGRVGDPTMLETLREIESLELGSDDPAAQQLLAVRDLADMTLANEGGMEELRAAVRGILARKPR